MSFEFQPIKYGWTALAAIAITGATIFVVNNQRQTVHQVDTIEIMLALHERCLATSNSAYDRVAPLEIARDWVTNCIVTNGTTNLAFYTNSVTNAFGFVMEPNVARHSYGSWYESHIHWGDVVAKVHELIPRYVSTNYDYRTNVPVQFLTVTGLFAELGIGDGTNQFTIRPATTNIQTNYVVAYTQDVSFWGYDEALPGGGQHYVSGGDYYVLRTNYAFTEFPSNKVYVYTSSAPQTVNFSFTHDTVPFTNMQARAYASNDTSIYGVTVPSGSFYIVYDTYSADPRVAYYMSHGEIMQHYTYPWPNGVPLSYDIWYGWYYGAAYPANYQYTNIVFSEPKVMTVTNSAWYGTPKYASKAFLEELYRVLHALRVTAGKTPELTGHRQDRWVRSEVFYSPVGVDTFDFEAFKDQKKAEFTAAGETAFTGGTFIADSSASWDGPYYDGGAGSNVWYASARIRGGEIYGILGLNFNQDVPHQSFAPQAVEVFMEDSPRMPAIFSPFGSVFETGVYYSASESSFSTTPRSVLSVGNARFVENIEWGELINDGHEAQRLRIQFRPRSDGLGKIVTEWQFQYCTNKYW